MPLFTLHKGDDAGARQFANLPPIARGYIEALFFTSEAAGTESDTADGSIPGDCTFQDLAPETLALIESDCRAFETAAADLLHTAAAADYDLEQAGRDFWYTRNGHGVGFWDRDELSAKVPDSIIVSVKELRPWSVDSIGNALSSLAQYAGTADAYQGDDGRIYLS